MWTDHTPTLGLLVPNDELLASMTKYPSSDQTRRRVKRGTFLFVKIKSSQTNSFCLARLHFAGYSAALHQSLCRPLYSTVVTCNRVPHMKLCSMSSLRLLTRV